MYGYIIRSVPFTCQFGYKKDPSWCAVVDESTLSVMGTVAIILSRIFAKYN